MSNQNELNKETLEYVASANITHRKKLGQYFTQKKLRDDLLLNIPKKDHADILEPSCGTGEFLSSILSNFNNPSITAYDIDPAMIEISSKQYNQNIQQADFLSLSTDQKFDYIIGNPPYFELALSKEEKKKYKEIICGRINIYALFIYKCIQMLKDGGILAFIIPTSINSGSYFSKLRQYIIQNCDILYLKQYGNDDFLDADQTTQSIILQKKPNTGKYIFSKSGIVIFSELYKEYETMYSGSVSLYDLGYTVKTGNVVWNQHKEKLSDNKRDTDIPLIYAKNIKNGQIILNKDKQQYIQQNEIDYFTTPTILCNRIVGIGDHVNINFVICDLPKYYAENHVNVILPDNPKINIKELVTCLNSQRSINLVKRLSGNTQLSKTEIQHLYPIFLESL
jgi:adenine-specific DNA-methyltransferase